MIALALSILRRSGREAAIRLAVTTSGVALGVALLLYAAAAWPALHAHDTREAWVTSSANNRMPAPQPTGGRVDAVLWRFTADHLAGRELSRVDVAPLGAAVPLPPGLTSYPAPGTMLVSPALRDALRQRPAAQLADRFDARVAGLLPDRALRYPGQLLTVVGHRPAELRAQPPIEAVTSIETAPARHAITSFLRLVIVIGAAGLIFPVVIFVATSTRLGAARRDQRLAAIRLAGGTPRQVHQLASVEAALAGLCGTALGVVGFWLTRPAAAAIPFDGYPFFASDLRPPTWQALLILAGVPLLCTATAVASLRRVSISPLGVSRRSRADQPSARRLVVLAVGLVGFALSLLGLSTGALGASGSLGIGLVLASFVLIVAGIALAGPWFTAVIARALAGRTRRASTLLAVRHLGDNPTAAFRAISGVVLAVFVGTMFSAISPAVTQSSGLTANRGTLRPDVLAATPQAAPPATVRGLVTRLRSVPGVRQVTTVRAVPTLTAPSERRPIAAIASCAQVQRLLTITPAACPGPRGRTTIPASQRHGDFHGIATLIEPSSLPAAAVARTPVRYLAVLTDGSTATIETARTLIDRAIPSGANPQTTTEINAQRFRQVAQLQRMVNVGMLLTLLIAGCSLAVAVAGGLIERRRPFALLRLSGMRLKDLRATILAEAAIPLAAVALVSVVLGLLVARFILLFGGGGSVWPSASLALTLAAGVVGALLITTSTLPLLSRLTAPDQPAARFE